MCQALSWALRKGAQGPVGRGDHQEGESQGTWLLVQGRSLRALTVLGGVRCQARKGGACLGTEGFRTGCESRNTAVVVGTEATEFNCGCRGKALAGTSSWGRTGRAAPGGRGV